MLRLLRLLRPGGRVCTVTDSEEIIRRREILSGYFPETVEVELARYPRIAHLESWMAAAGLVAIEVVTVEQPYEVTSCPTLPRQGILFAPSHCGGCLAGRPGTPGT